MYAWREGSRPWTPLDERLAKRHIAALDAELLSNHFPPYALSGGLYYALVESDGRVVSVPILRRLSHSHCLKLLKELESVRLPPSRSQTC